MMELTQLICIFFAMTTQVYGMRVTQTYRDPDGQKLGTIGTDKYTGDIIIGASRNMVKLSENLVPKEKVVLDEPSVAKAVLVDSLRDRVVLCKTGQGSCDVRTLGNLSNILYSHHKSIVPKDSKSRILLFTSSNNQIHLVSDLIGKQYSDSVPTISSRSIENLGLAHSDVKGSSSLSARKNVPKNIHVQYIYGFHHGNFFYLIANQPKELGTKINLVSKIIRICADDRYYRSYVEVQLDCGTSSGELFPHATAAYYDAVSQRVSISFGQTRTSKSAVCVFDLREIDDRMVQAIRSCYQGDGIIGPAFFQKRRSCVPTSAEPDFCGQSEVSEAYPSIEGTVPLYERPVITLSDARITALTTEAGEAYTVIYLGTSSGSLKKATVSTDDGHVSMVSEVKVGQGHIQSPLLWNLDRTALYTMTEEKLSRVSVNHCSEKTTCQQCTASQDPICGWCVLKNSCTPREFCPLTAVSPSWLPAQQGVCAEITDLQPATLSYRSLETGAAMDKHITFKLGTVSVLNSSDLDLQCSFAARGRREATAARMIGDRITCPLPQRTRLQSIPAEQDHSTVEVELHVHGRPIVKRDVSYYDCQINQNCTACTESSFGCKWCHVRGMCIEVREPICPDQTAAAVVSSGLCPRLETSAQEPDIVVHSGRTKQIALRVANIKRDLTRNIHCLFTFLGEVKVVSGTIKNSNLLCEPQRFEYNGSYPIVTATFTVTSGANSVPLDNPQDIKVRIYKCGPMVTNCGQCLSMDPEYECGWCTKGNAQCSLPSDCSPASWLDRQATCPNPQILRFEPSTGPVQGITNISVTGINLGKASSDLEVTVAGVRCTVHPEHYEPSIQFQCLTEPANTVKEGVIKVKVNGQYQTKSTSKFKFVDPVVTSLSPKRGPQSGGTTLTISGEEMNTGTMTTVDIEGSPCRVTMRNFSALECVTSQQSANQNEVDVEVNFGNLRKVIPEKFTYVKDPEITMIEPKKTILSGGTTITAMGNQMQYIQNPEFFVDLGNKKITARCALQQLTFWLVCQTPQLDFPGENITITSPKEVQYGFRLDGVMTFLNISKDIGPMEYFPDPQIEELPPKGDNAKKYAEGEVLVIKGGFATLNSVLKDMSVTVGGSSCPITSLTESALQCTPPETPKTVDGSGYSTVKVQIGNMNVDAGYMRYYENDDGEKPIAIGIILGVVIPIVAIIILLAYCVIRRHRKNKPNQDYIPDVWKETDVERGEEEIALNHVSVKADMNGSIPDDKDTGPYIEEILSKVEDEGVCQNIREFLIHRRRLDIGDLLGKGNFGVTYKATYSKSDDENPTDVACKTLQGNQTGTDSIAQFLQTIAGYRDLQHPSVAPITGGCITVSDDPIVVNPYTQNGDLKSYVRDSNRNLTVLELLEMAVQVAEAMAYLESVHVVHSNLAARNCLVTEQKKVLVSEYGLTKDLFDPEQYLVEDGRTKNLVKWMAPEVTESLEFNTQSDVWSYGVLLWELLTRGVTPYPDVSNSDLPGYLETGNRMKKPRQCPENIYELMLRCWSQDPSARPTFQQIGEEIQSFISTTGDDQSPSDTAPLQSNIDVANSGEFV